MPRLPAGDDCAPLEELLIASNPWPYACPIAGIGDIGSSRLAIGLGSTWACVVLFSAAGLLVACDDPTVPSVETEVVPVDVEMPAAKVREERPPRGMLVVFSRDYCAACRVMEPWVEELGNEQSAIDVVHVNVDRTAHEHIGRFFQVTAVPALAFIDDSGEIRERREGLTTKAQMIAVLRRLGWVE